MRTIDADALSAFVGDLRSTLHKEQSTFKAMTEIEFNTRDYMLLNFQYTIDNAPTVDVIPNAEGYKMYNKGYAQGYERGKAEKRPTGEWIPVKDLNNFIRTCREELFEKMKDYPPQEFEIRENMLLNFEQIVKLASSKYEADIRGE